MKKKKKPEKQKTVTFKRYVPLTLAEPLPKAITGRPREWSEGLIEQKRKALEKWMANPKNYYFNSYLIEEDLHPGQIERFCNYSESFRETYKKALLIQENRLVELALTRKHDGGFTKFVMANKCGWKEKQEISGDAANPLSVIMDRIAESAKDPLDYDE